MNLMSMNLMSMNWAFLLSDPMPMLMGWGVGSFLTVLIPSVHWHRNKQSYYQQYGYAVEAEQQQRAYEEAQKQQEEQYNNNNNYNNNGQYQNGMYIDGKYYTYNEIANANGYSNNCGWWQWGCRRNQYNVRNYARNNNEDDRDDEVQLPSWYKFIGGTTEDDQRMREEMGMNAQAETGAMKFVYTWSLLMFMALVLYGGWALYHRHDTRFLMILLALFMQMALVTLLLTGQGAVKTDERNFDESIYGFYGQLSVLLVYQEFWYLLHTMVFLAALAVRSFLMTRYSSTSSDSNADMKTAMVRDDYVSTDKLGMA